MGVLWPDLEEGMHVYGSIAGELLHLLSHAWQAHHQMSQAAAAGYRLPTDRICQEVTSLSQCGYKDPC
jgi:hypothetical protein